MNWTAPEFGKTGDRVPVLPLVFIAGLTYALILLFVWAPFAMTNGMGWETYYTVVSESSTSWRNFLYTPDPLRIFAAVVYELAYRLGAWTGARGSFVPYEVLYAILWWARSFVAFLLLRRITPSSAILPFTAGAIMLIHAPDVLIGWPGQMHQFGVFVCLLIALYLLLVALESSTSKTAWGCMAASWVFQSLCLWTYEGPLFIILAAAPAFLFLLWHRPVRLRIALAASWYLPSLAYLWLTYLRYFRHGGNGYQNSLLRHSFAPGDILSDWVFNVRYSLFFWSWQRMTGDIDPALVRTLAAGAVVAFAAMAYFVSQHEKEDSTTLWRGRMWRLLCVGIVFLILSFPAHLLLEGARSLRRTQLLSAIAASIVLGVAIYLVATYFPSTRFRPFLALFLVAPVMWVGACRVIERQAKQRAEWDPHLSAMRDLIRGVPRVKDGTIIVMTNVPKDRDPFYAWGFWYNNALRLAYPHTQVAGVFYYQDSEAAPGDNLRLIHDRWEYTGQDIAPLVQSAPVDNTLVLEFQGSGAPRIVAQIPSFLCPGGCSMERYHPETRILPGPPAPEPARRYGPL